MSQTESKEGKNRQYTFNLALAAVAGQVGCLTAGIIVVALLAGLFIDSRLNTRPTFTILFMALSVPFTLGAMFWIVRKVTSRIKQHPENKSDNHQEDTNRGKDE